MKAKQTYSGIPYCPVEKFEEFYMDEIRHPRPVQLQLHGDRRSSYFSIFLRTTTPCKTDIDINRTEFYKVLLVTKGAGVLRYGTNDCEVGPGCLLFLKPTQVKSWTATTPEQEGYYCIFNDLFLAANPVELGELRSNPLFAPSNSPVLTLDENELKRMQALFLDLYNTFSENGPFSSDMCRLQLKIILLRSRRLLQEANDENKVGSSAPAHLVQRFERLLEEEFAKRSSGSYCRTPSEYAERLCVHTNYLNASVKKATGKTTQEMIKYRILQEAQILLRHTQMTTSEIADELGFRETTHFCSYFKKITSVTPLQYRRASTSANGRKDLIS